MSKRGLFLDRDGVINIDHGYVGSVDRFMFRDGVFDALRQARRIGFCIFIVTNQAGVARGYYQEQDFRHLTSWMHTQFAQQSISIDGVYACFTHKDGHDPYNRDSFWRKPNPGMIMQAAQDYSVDLSRSIMVGDQPTDMQAAQRAGVGTCVFLGDPKNELGDGVKILADMVAFKDWMAQEP